MDNSISCDDKSCYGRKEKDYYMDKMSDFTLKLSNKQEYTVPAIDLIDDAFTNSTYKCHFAFYNSGRHFVLGETFLKSHYVVFDMRSYKVGIAPSLNFGSVEQTGPTPVPVPIDDNTDTRRDNDIDQPVEKIPDH